MLDEYLIGAHERNSPECDVPVINYSKTEYRAGGAANVALNLKSLNLNPILFSIVGRDQSATILSNLLRQEKIDFRFIPCITRPTTTKQRIVDTSFNQFLRIDKEQTNYLSKDEEASLLKSIELYLSEKETKAIVLQDYNKGILSMDLIIAIQKIAVKNKVPLFVDPKFDHFKLLSACTLFKPNLKELSAIYGKTISPNKEEITKAIASLDLNAKLIVVTLGEKGIYYFDQSSKDQDIIPTERIENPDVSGAGDTVIATLIWAFCQNIELTKMIQLANLAGASVCSKPGISLVDLKLLKGALELK